MVLSIIYISGKNTVMIIPFNKLSAEALKGVVDEFVTRDGTDYGLVEIDLEKKIDMVLKQLRSGDAFIVYDETTMTTSVVLSRNL